MSMDGRTAQHNKRAYNAGMAAFFLSGFCAISAGVIVSLLRDRYQFTYGFSGTLVSAMSIGNVVALLVSGILPGLIGQRATTLTLTAGYCIGYLISALTGNPIFLLLAFLLAGMSKGGTASTCTVLVGSNTDDRPRALNLMNAWFALGALLCPFLISSLQGIGASLPMLCVSLAGLGLWLVFCFSPLPGRAAATGGASGKTD
jgi:MFS family permease